MKKNKHKNLVLVSVSLLVLALIWFVKPKLARTRQNTNIMTVGVSADFPPFTYIEKDQIVGFEIDLVQAIATRLGKQIELKNMPFATLLPTLQMGQLQVVAAGLTATPERAQHVLFTEPYVQDNPLVIVSLVSNPIRDVSGLVQQEVIVNEGYTSDLYLSKIEGILLKRLKTPAEAFLALKSGRAAAFVTACDTIKPFFAQETTQDFVVANIPDTSESAALAIALAYPDLLKEIQACLDDMQQDGSLKALKTKWQLS